MRIAFSTGHTPGGPEVDQQVLTFEIGKFNRFSINIYRVKISCHGSDFIVQQIVKLLLKHGARLANAGEFTKRAFLNGQFDLAQAEAVADLIASDSALSHEVAMKQMRGGLSGMLSIRVAGGESAAIGVAARVQLWKRATSLGGVESLVEHRASVEGAGTPCPPDLLRLSVGLEDPADLIADLDQALS